MGLLKCISSILRGVEVGKSKDRVSETNQIEENRKKGYEFENCVVNLFDLEKYFTIITWNTDSAGKYGDKRVESNKNPDLVMRFDPSNEKFAVECKYRSKLVNGNLCWSYPKQIERYNQYEQAESIPTFIVIGLHGNPSNPERMFCVPLKNAEYPTLFPSRFEKFERLPPNKKFFWKNGILR